jgi:NADPH:quinone reductase-like Zn-dependent oxidoreductase
MAFDAAAGPGTEALAAATAPNGVLFVHGPLSGQPTPLPGLNTMRPVFTGPCTVLEITADQKRLERAQQYFTTGPASRALRPLIDRPFALDDNLEAHRYPEAGAHVGKIVVTTAHHKEKSGHTGTATNSPT